MVKLEDIHDCEKCHGKLVFVEIDETSGKTKCGYCGKEVDYSPWTKQVIEKWRKKENEKQKRVKE